MICGFRTTPWSARRARASSTRWATFDRSRPEIGAIATGVAQRALDECLRYSRSRSAFGQPIASFQAIQFMLAEYGQSVSRRCACLTYKAAWMVESRETPNAISSYAKLFGSDACMKITTDAVQIFGGYGYMKEYPVEKLMRDAKLLQIYEGTSQIQHVGHRARSAEGLTARGPPHESATGR